MSSIQMIKLEKLVEENKIEEAKELISSFIFKTVEGYFIYNNIHKTYQFITKTKLSDILPDDIDNSEFIYCNRIPKTKQNLFSLKKYLQTNKFMTNCYGIDIDYTQDNHIFKKTTHIEGKEIHQNILNMKKSLPFNNQFLQDIKISDYQEEIDLINTHLFEVLSSSNKQQYEYLLNFIAFSAAGIKTRTALYLQSGEGVGKGVYMYFLETMFGDRFHKTSSVETITKYTKPLEGRCLINIDELTGENSGSSHMIQDQLKGLITEKSFDCRDMYKLAYTQKNTFNIIITTNNNAVNLTYSNNRRYVCFDISKHRTNDFEYFNKLTKAMSRESVKPAYFKFLMNRYQECKNFNFDDKPTTSMGTYKITLSMPPLLRYVKEQYILKKVNLDLECKEFVKNYNMFSGKSLAAISIHRDLSDKIGLVKKRTGTGSNRIYRFMADYLCLLETFKKNKWMVDEELDIFDDSDDDNDDEDKKYLTDEIKIMESQNIKIKTLVETNKKISKLNEENEEKLKSFETIQKKLKRFEEVQEQLYAMGDKINDADEIKIMEAQNNKIKKLVETNKNILKLNKAYEERIKAFEENIKAFQPKQKKSIPTIDNIKMEYDEIDTNNDDEEEEDEEEEEEEEEEKPIDFSEMKVAELREFVKSRKIDRDCSKMKKKDIQYFLKKNGPYYNVKKIPKQKDVGIRMFDGDEIYNF